jgi:hypothetical protein
LPGDVRCAATRPSTSPSSVANRTTELRPSLYGFLGMVSSDPTCDESVNEA